MTLDDQGILEELHLEVVVVDAGELHDDLDRRGRLVRVGIRTPAGLDQEAKALALPDLADRPGLARTQYHRVPVAEASVAHDPIRKQLCALEQPRSIADGRVSRRRHATRWPVGAGPGIAGV